MSETRVGERAQQPKIAMTIIGLLCAPVVGNVLATVIIVIYLAATTSGPVIVGPTSATLTFSVPAIYGAIVGCPIAFAAGWPIHAILLKRGHTSPLIYIAIATCISLLAMLAFSAGLARAIGPFTISNYTMIGAIGGLVFWLIRRPDLDTRPAVPPAPPHEQKA